MTEVLGTAMDVVAAACLLAGSALALVAGLGILRFPDLLARMHVATKPQVLGLLLMLLGLALRLPDAPVVWMLVLVALFQLLTSPVAAHMVARAGYRTGKVREDLLVVDELTQDLARARAEVEAHAHGEDVDARPGDRAGVGPGRHAPAGPDHRAVGTEDPRAT